MRERGRRGSREGEPEQVLYLGSGARVGESIRIEGSEADHARRSLRIRSGDAIHLVDGVGHRFAGHVADLDKRSIEVAVESVEDLSPWPDQRLILAAGVLRSTRMDQVVEKASELGVERFVPLVLARSVARPHEAGAKLDRWRRIAVESLKQCRRATLMDVAEPMELGAFLLTLPETGTLWVADPDGEDPRHRVDPPWGGGPLVCVVGPEGGLDETEMGLLQRRGGLGVRLGGHRLRAETASLALVAAALTVIGAMGKTS